MTKITSSKISSRYPQTSKPSEVIRKSSARRAASYSLCRKPSFVQSVKTQMNKYRASAFASSRPKICKRNGLKEVRNRNRTHAQPLSSPILSSSARSHPRGNQTRSLSSQALSRNTSTRLRRCSRRRKTSGRCHRM